MRPFLIGGLAIAAWGGLQAQDRALAERGRLRPPQAIECDRNQLTSYAGRVTAYAPGAERTRIQISTDEDTLESVTVEHAGQADASARYLLWGEAFAPGDLDKIEASPGHLREGMRAVAWVCLDGKVPPRIDWQPPQP